MERVFKTIQIQGHNTKSEIRMEKFENGRELVNVCAGRTKVKGFDSDHFSKDYRCDKSFEGVSNMSEAFNMLNNGWTEKVDDVKQVLKDVERRNYSEKNAGLKPDVVGFVPIVPSALMGLPNSMLNTNVKPKKNKVINIVYGLSFSCRVDKEDIIKAGLKVMGAVIRLEAQGFRVRLTAFQNYSTDNGSLNHLLAIKVKSEDQPLDAQRVMFPMFHPAMFRSIGFGWYERLPESTYIYGYGKPIYYTMSEAKIDDLMSQIFGRTAIYLDGTYTMNEGDAYIQRRLKGVTL